MTTERGTALKRVPVSFVPDGGLITGQAREDHVHWRQSTIGRINGAIAPRQPPRRRSTTEALACSQSVGRSRRNPASRLSGDSVPPRLFNALFDGFVPFVSLSSSFCISVNHSLPLSMVAAR